MNLILWFIIYIIAENEGDQEEYDYDDLDLGEESEDDTDDVEVEVNSTFSTSKKPYDRKPGIKLLFKFLWDNKPDKIKRKEITLPSNQGGLNMIDIEFVIASLKITWLRRLLTQ